jgi:hypothetical protein
MLRRDGDFLGRAGVIEEREVRKGRNSIRKGVTMPQEKRYPGSDIPQGGKA